MNWGSNKVDRWLLPLFLSSLLHKFSLLCGIFYNSINSSSKTATLKYTCGSAWNSSLDRLSRTITFAEVHIHEYVWDPLIQKIGTLLTLIGYYLRSLTLFNFDLESQCVYIRFYNKLQFVFNVNVFVCVSSIVTTALYYCCFSYSYTEVAASLAQSSKVSLLHLCRSNFHTALRLWAHAKLGTWMLPLRDWGQWELM